jgi:beta-glucosidase
MTRRGSWTGTTTGGFSIRCTAARTRPRCSSGSRLTEIREGDLEYIVRHGTDFLGVNYYFRKIVRASPTPAVLEFEEIVPEGARTTEMGWEVYAPGLYTLLTRLSAEYGNPRIFVTENGAAFPDTKIEDGVVQDDDRVEYLSRHIREAARAVESGVRLEGYYVWSLLDNFEWAHGYSKRFGLFRVEYDTQERLWKKSARWYRSVIEANGPSDPE